jgi:hypothetical protein
MAQGLIPGSSRVRGEGFWPSSPRVWENEGHVKGGRDRFSGVPGAFLFFCQQEEQGLAFCVDVAQDKA